MKQLLIILFFSVVLGCTVMGVRNSEEASYTLLYEENNFQIRLYDQSLVAQTQTTGGYKESGNEAFRHLAGYIFGRNQTQKNLEMETPVLEKSQYEKIAMTVPVYQQEDSNHWTMTFVLPSKYTLETIPKPLDENIEIKMLPARKVATIRYTGRINLKKIEDNTVKLQSWLELKDYTPNSKAYSAAYDPPWTIPFLRRNEIHIEIL